MIEKFLKNWKKNGGLVIETQKEGWFVCNGDFAVSNKGAIFISEYSKELFLKERVIIKLKKEKIVKGMTEAFEQIKKPGIFVAGASKTADVESYLVLGAHGAKEVAVLLEERKTDETDS